MPTTNEERISKLLHFPLNSYLMLRLDFVLLTDGDELEAMLLRIIEMHMEDERRRLYRARINAAPSHAFKPEQEVEIPRNVWVPISHKRFFYHLYGMIKSENTLKRAIKSLVDKGLIFTRHLKKTRYDPPEYQLNIARLEEEFAKMGKQGKAGYQTVRVSHPDHTTPSPKNQNWTPSQHQEVMPLSPDRVSELDPTHRSNGEKKDSVETAEEKLSCDDVHMNDVTSPAARLSSLELSDEELSVLVKVVKKLRNQPATEAERPQEIPQPCVTQASKRADTQEMHQERAPMTVVQREERSRKDEERAPAPLQVPMRPAEDAPLMPETLVQINEFKRGARFEETMRAAQLQAARTILALSEPIGIADFERAFDEFNNAKGRALYGEILVSHLAEVEPKHGRHRILRVLDRLRHREQSRARTPTQHETAPPPRLSVAGQPDLTDAQRAQLEAIKAKLGKSQPPQTIGA